VKNHLTPHFKGRSRHLKENSKYAVAIALGLTLDNAALTAGDLLGMRLKEDRLVAHLTKKQPKAVAGLNQAERRLYALMLKKASAEIMQIATTLTGYDLLRDHGLFDDHTRILDALERLLSVPNAKASSFESAYKKMVIKNLDVFEDFGVAEAKKATQNQSLSVAFVPLDVASARDYLVADEKAHYADLAPEMADAELMARGMRGKMPSKELAFARAMTRGAILVERVLFNARRHVIEGPAGSGKSTLLQWVAVQSARGSFSDTLASWNNSVPFFIRLRECVEEGFPLEIETWPNIFTSKALGGKPDDWVYDQFGSHRAVILLDGMDEVPKSKRPEMLRAVQDLVALYPAARFVISSRPAAIDKDEWPEWQKWVEQEHFVTSSLEPMSDAHLQMFIEHWHKALKGQMRNEMEEQKLQEGGQKLHGVLKTRPELDRMARTPLLAAMICVMYYELDRRLPRHRNELYEACLNMLVLHRDERRGIMEKLSEYPDIDKRRRLRMLQELAVWMLRSGLQEADDEQAEISRTDAEAQFANFLEERDIEGVDVVMVRKLFVERTALLREKRVGHISFTHKTFQEYLAATAIVSEAGDGELLENCARDSWREVIILATGEMGLKRATKFIEGMLARIDEPKDDQATHRKLTLLALACLETAEVSGSVRKKLVEMAQTILPLTSADEAKLFARAGKDVIPLLAYDESHDE
ncbi:MAG: NACHT domain-containing protein, partial [Chloroflexi bacterium]|nr:NACHT domain-containing protein [Chloroflexota bacterium]